MPLLRSRPIGVQVLLAGLVPAAYGAVCGWLLGVNKTAYLIASLVAVAGGYLAGRDHDGAGEGAKREFDISKLEWSEYLGFAGAAVLFGSLFLPWFSTSCDSLHPLKPSGCNPHSVLHGQVGDFTAFQTYKILDVLLVAACTA